MSARQCSTSMPGACATLAGRVSGSTSAAHSSTAALNAAMNKKIASQPKAVSRMPPISGEIIGAITMAVVTRPIMAAARSRS